jgi:hypothetical protein
VVERLDEERTAVLRAWGTRLMTDARAELRAAGKAIMILIDEIDRLQADVRCARDGVNPPLVEAIKRHAEQEPAKAGSSLPLGSSLRERLSAVIPSRATYDCDD